MIFSPPTTRSTKEIIADISFIITEQVIDDRIISCRISLVTALCYNNTTFIAKLRFLTKISVVMFPRQAEYRFRASLQQIHFVSKPNSSQNLYSICTACHSVQMEFVNCCFNPCRALAKNGTRFWRISRKFSKFHTGEPAVLLEKKWKTPHCVDKLILT